MSQIEKTVFISYRRANFPWAQAIFQDLTSHGYDVFIDYENIGGGDFEQVILGNIKSRAHFLIVLTPSALERTVEPGDWLRREIEAALDTQRNIVPLMVEGFDFGSPSIKKYLGGKLARLKSYNALPIPATFFPEAMERLRGRYLNVTLEAVLHPLSESASQAAHKQQSAASNATAVRQEALSAQEWFEKGYTQALIEQFSKSIDSLNESIHLQPDFAEAYFRRGLARVEQSDLKGAIGDYEQAIHFKPNYAEAYFHRGNAHFNQGNLNGAIGDYDQAILLQPADDKAYRNRGRARIKNREIIGGLQDYALGIWFWYIKKSNTIN